MNGVSCIPFIISGAPRSGTSLVYNLFDGHSKIAWLLSEGFLFENLFPFTEGEVKIFLETARTDADLFIEGLRDKQLMPPLHEPYRQNEKLGSVSEFRLEFGWNEVSFRNRIVEALPKALDVRSLWQAVVEASLAGLGAKARMYACMKAPDYGKSAVAALQHTDDARDLVILRDPYRALSSLKRSRDMRGEKRLTWPLFALCILEMRKMLERIEGADTNRLKWIRYEDLTRHPRQLMSAIAEWLEIDFEETLLQPTMLGRTWPGISSFEPTAGIETKPAERALMVLTDHEREVIRSHLRQYEKYGYAIG